MPVASPPEDYIYQGVWINWLKGGQVFGATLTLNPSKAAILSPALALIISIAGSQLWRLFQFSLHQIRATHEEKNLLYHQQQVTLRNTSTDLNTLWRLLRLAFAWRRHRDIKVFWQSFPLTLWTTLHLSVVVTIGLLSSWLLHASNDVLVRSPWCGYFNEAFDSTVWHGDWNDTATLTEVFKYEDYRNSWFANVQQAFDICEISPASCAFPLLENMAYQRTVVPGACPYKGDVCHPNSQTIKFDTGYLSSATALGLNAPEKDRVTFRMLASCAPLNDAKYATGWHEVNASSTLPARNVSTANYGRGSLNATANTTFTITKQVMGCSQQAALLPYVLRSQFHNPTSSLAGNNATFDPIPEIETNDSDNNLIMLMSNSYFYTPVSDPWFSTQSIQYNTSAYCANTLSTVYIRERPLTTVGCTQQWQICRNEAQTDGNNAECTPLGSSDQVRATLEEGSELAAQFTGRQLATARQITRAMSGSSFYYLIYALSQTNGAPIKARHSARRGTIGLSLPDTQWQVETEYWMQLLLAYLQRNSINLNTGQFSPDTKWIDAFSTILKADDPARWLCQNQIIQNSTYRNFNLFALILCVTTCVLLTILGLTIEDLIGFIRQRSSENIRRHGRRDMWFVNSDLEMLRTITELKTKLRWGRSAFGIPFAPARAKATLNDLQNNHSRTLGPHETFYTMDTTSRANTVMTESPAETRQIQNYGHKSCLTCESLLTISSGSTSSVPKPLKATPPIRGRHTPDEVIHFSNAVRDPADQSEPLMEQVRGHPTAPNTIITSHPEVQPLQQVQTRHRHDYSLMHPNVSIETDSADTIITQPFHYEHNIPPPRNALSDVTNDQTKDTHDTQFQTFALGDFRDKSRSRSPLPQRSRAEITQRSRWSWLRKDDRDGTIC